MPNAARTAGTRDLYVFEGREVTLPVEVRDASSASATYVVPSRAARLLLGCDDLEVAEVVPGRTLFSIAVVDYRDNDLGDYNEVSLAFFVRTRQDAPAVPYFGNVAAFLRSRLATYIHRLPVDQSFTCAAGQGIWGFPKTVEQITVHTGKAQCSCTLTSAGRRVLTFSAGRGGKMRLPETEMTTYSHRNGVLCRTRFVSGAEGVGMRLGGATLELGEHPIADELRSLGLPKRPLLSVWMEHMHGRFDAPVAV